MQSTLHVKNGYNRLVGVYDLLKQIVFGNVLTQAELKSVQWLKDCNTVLILGGGTGLFLEALVQLRVKHIIYVELSDKMIAKAKKRVGELEENNSEVIYIPKSWEEFKPELKVDAVVCNFFLDMFPESAINKIITHYSESAKPKALWYITDFYLESSSSFLNKFLIKAMYVFFVATCKIEAKQLPQLFSCFEKHAFDEKVRFKSDYLRQSIFQKK